MRQKFLAYTAVGAVYLSLSSPAAAYLDGATASMVLQALIGGAATAAFYFRSYLAKTKNFFTRKTRRD